MISMATMFMNYLWSFPIQLIGSIVAVGIVLGLAVLGDLLIELFCDRKDEIGIFD